MIDHRWRGGDDSAALDYQAQALARMARERRALADRVAHHAEQRRVALADPGRALTLPGAEEARATATTAACITPQAPRRRPTR